MTGRARHSSGTPLPVRRALLAGIVAVPLAIVSGAQALSSTAMRRVPETALAVFPWNGMATAEVAYGKLTSAAAASMTQTQAETGAPRSVPRTAELARLAAASGASARAAIGREPLAVRAFVMLALAEGDSARRRTILTTAGRLTRRDQTLQSLLIEEHGRAGDYPAMIGALDATLRVHPEWREVFFPALARTLAEEPAVVPAFARLLARPLPWREAFLEAAVRAPGAPDNLAAVRQQIALDNRAFDRKLIARLAGDGRIAAAERIYAKVASPPAGGAGAGLGWRADYPPFDWQLTDQPGLRAQSGERSGTLDVAVSPGNGGVIAARLLRNPGAPFAVRFTAQVEPQAQTSDLRLLVACAGGTGGDAAPFFDRPFAPGGGEFSVDQVPACPFLMLTITARAWTGKPPLQATLSPAVLTVGPRAATPR